MFALNIPNKMIPTPILLFLAFFTFTTVESSTQLNNYVGNFCLNINGNYTQGSTFQTNLKTLLSTLESKSSSSSFFTATITAPSSEDTIFGRYYCRRDLPLEKCSSCVKIVAKQIVAECPVAKEAIIFYEHCTLVYLNSSARLDDHFVVDVSSMLSYSKVIAVDKFYPILTSTVNRLINESAYGSSSDGFATTEAYVSQFETLYSLAQCSSDMTGLSCERCLKNVLLHVDSCCKEDAELEYFYPSCQLRYSVLAPFYEVSGPLAQMPTSPPPPAVSQAAESSDRRPPQGSDAVALSCRIILQFALIAVMFILRN